MADELHSAKPDEIGDAPNGVSDAVLEHPPAPRFGRRRWLIAVGGLLLAATQVPIALRIARRWSRRSCEIIVDRPADVAPDADEWGVSLDQYECDFINPMRLGARYSTPGQLMVVIEFRSKGPVDARRRNRVTVDVFDAAGRLLGRDVNGGTDERTWPNIHPTTGARLKGFATEVVAPFTFGDVGPERLARVRIRFDEET